MKLFDIFKRKKEEPVPEVVEEQVEQVEEIVDAPVENEPEATVEETYKHFQEEYDRTYRDYRTIWDTCAREGLSYEEMLYRSQDIRKRLQRLSAQMRYIQEPSVKYEKNVKGDRYPIEDFKEMCKSGVLSNSDGFGVYATKKSVSDVEIYPSDVTEDELVRTDFTHVVWFNK